MEKQGSNKLPSAKSGAIEYLCATLAAFPPRTGLTERIQAMNDAMDLAIQARFGFAKGDAEILEGQLALSTALSRFEPLSPRRYSNACKFGGTYSRMWEVHHKQRPWMAKYVATTEAKILQSNRVAPGLAVLIFSLLAGDDPTLARVGKYQVWMCKTQTETEIELYRYRYADFLRNPFHYTNSPAKLLKLSRREWDALQSSTTPWVDVSTTFVNTTERGELKG